MASYQVLEVSSVFSGTPVTKVWLKDNHGNEFHYHWRFSLEGGHWRMCGGELAEEGFEVIP